MNLHRINLSTNKAEITTLFVHKVSEMFYAYFHMACLDVGPIINSVQLFMYNREDTWSI